MAKYGGTLVGWDAWYEGLAVFKSRSPDPLVLQADFIALPDDGALAFVEFYIAAAGVRQRRIIDSGDWYFWDPEQQCIEYVPCGEWDTWMDEPTVENCLSCVKKSGAVNDEQWSEIEAALLSASFD